MAKKQGKQTLKDFGEDASEEIIIRKPSIREFFHYLFVGLIFFIGFFIAFNLFFGIVAAYYSFAYITNSQNLIDSLPSFFRFWSILWIILAFSLIGTYLSRRNNE